MGLFKTIDEIVGSPYRSRFWKIADVLFLGLLWFTTAMSVAIWIDGHEWSTWSVIVRVLMPITIVATARSWYRHPRLSKRARQRLMERSSYSGSSDESESSSKAPLDLGDSTAHPG